MRTILLKQDNVQDKYYPIFLKLHNVLETKHKFDKYKFRQLKEKLGIPFIWNASDRFNVDQVVLLPLIERDLMEGKMKSPVLEKSYVNLQQ